MRSLKYRSKLFVNGSEPHLFDEAFSGSADSLSFNNEDLVDEKDKGKSREAIANLLGKRVGKKIIQVRVNGTDTPHFREDVEALVLPGVDIVNIPKVSTPEEAIKAAELVIEIEKKKRIGREIAIIANIETPRGFRNAAAIAGAHRRIIGLQIGYGDLIRPFGIDFRGVGADIVRLHVRLASAEAGVFAFDGVYIGPVDDVAPFRTDVQKGVDLGMTGKSCKTEAQVQVVNALFAR